MNFASLFSEWGSGRSPSGLIGSENSLFALLRDNAWEAGTIALLITGAHRLIRHVVGEIEVDWFPSGYRH